MIKEFQRKFRIQILSACLLLRKIVSTEGQQRKKHNVFGIENRISNSLFFVSNLEK